MADNLGVDNPEVDNPEEDNPEKDNPEEEMLVLRLLPYCFGVM